MEVGACVNRYSAPIMRTAVIGLPSDTVKLMADACQESVDIMIEHIRPGVQGCQVAAAAGKALRNVPDDLVWHGYYGYSVGLGFPPSWADCPIYITETDKTELKAGMVFHCNTSLRSIGRFGVACGETILVSDKGCEVLTSLPRALAIR